MHSFFYNASELLQQAEENRHRLLVTVSGEYQWAEKTTEQLLNLWHADALWVSDKTLDNRHCIDFNTSRRWLGRELNYLVFDAHSSFDPNVFSLLCGTVKAGGALLLLTPPLRHWQYHPDPVNKRCSVWNAEVLRSRYLDRLSRLIPAHSQLLLQQSGKHARRTNSSELSESNGDREQQNVVQAIAQDFKNSTRPQLHVISGDRGRGKSSALGRLAARLIEGGAQRVLLTAPRKAAVDLVLKHAELDTVDQKSLREKLVFVAPDRLVLEPLPCDVLLVDEMGGIHLGLLKRLLQHYTNTVLAGTVHGYEGAGRGFHTRFKKMLDQRYSHCQWHRLEHPMRWGPSDPLEHSSNALMMLDAEAPTPAQGETTVHFLNRDQLSLDEPLLRQIHGLLAAAHYRTRPLDLRQMLDGPNIQIAVSKIADTV
ncbi:MAG: tRNA(Met) cytidine acetyltransferase TmcA domain-containing protein, partial [Granulosicoccaceae bacterium]